MKLFQPHRRPPKDVPPSAALARGASIEVLPRTAAQVADFAALLPLGTRVYIAHIDGTPITDMVATARRLRREGMEPMAHVPARSIADRAMLEDWIARYQGEAGMQQALVLAGGRATPCGDFHSSMQLLETGAFDRAGFTHLHVAGHPEGNRDIDPGGGEDMVMAAARWKSDFAQRSDAQMALVTQFAFEAAPILDWTRRLETAGVNLPVIVGVAGPARLQTLIKYAVACGVGPSMQVLQRRSRDVTKLLLPFKPTALVASLAAHVDTHPDGPITGLHLFPLGGIAASARWMARHCPPAASQHTAGRGL